MIHQAQVHYNLRNGYKFHDNLLQVLNDHEIYHPHLHELWMRLTVVGMLVAFGIYAQMIVAARRRAEEAARLANAELTHGL